MNLYNRFLDGLFRLRPFLLVMLAGLSFTALLAWWIAMQGQQDTKSAVERLTLVAAGQIEAHFNIQSEMLRGMQGAFIANNALGRENFQQILEGQNALVRLPGFMAVVFARHLERDQMASFVAQPPNMRDKAPQIQGRAMHPPTSQPAALAVDYLYPVNSSTESYLGLDLLSLANNRIPLAMARDDGRGIASPVFRLGEAANAPLVFMLHYPVYHTGARLFTSADRQQHYHGMLSALYRVDQSFSLLSQDVYGRMSSARLYDTGGSLDRRERLSMQLIQEVQRSVRDEEMCSSRIVNLPGRQWRLDACSSQSLIGPSRDGLWLCWLLGGTLSLFLAASFQLRVKSHEMAIRMADEMTADLRKHEDRLRKLEMLANEAHDIFVIRDLHGRIEYANPEAQRRFAQDGKSLEQMTEPLLVSAELGALSEPMLLQCSHRNVLGDVRHYEAMLLPMRDPYGQYRGSALVARDVTRRLEQSEALRENNERLSDLLALSSDCLWEQDVDARFTHVSGGFFKVNDINPAHQVGRNRWESAHAGMGEAEWEVHRRAIEEHRPYRDFVFTLRGGREPLIVSVSGKPVFDNAGFFIGYRGVGRDITALYQARLLAQSEKQRVEATLESLSDGVLTTDLNGRIDYMNPVAIALIGREMQEALGQSIEMVFQLVDPLTRLPLPSLARQVLANHNAPLHHRTAILLNRFGLTFTIQEAIACIRDAKGDVVGSVLVFRDMSDWLVLADSLPAAGESAASTG